jgi:hypothetical protein
MPVSKLLTKNNNARSASKNNIREMMYVPFYIGSHPSS